MKNGSKEKQLKEEDRNAKAIIVIGNEMLWLRGVHALENVP
jgi:hypothetical protein